jgi:pilus assembly protein CpaF
VTTGSDLQRLADTIGDVLRHRADDTDLNTLITDQVQRHRPLASDADRAALTGAIRARLGGLDRLDPFLADPTVDEILVGNGVVWVEQHGRVEAVDRIDAATTRRVIEQVIAPLGRRLDRTSPIVDARLADGSRVCAVVEPVAVDGPALSIRRFADRVRPLDDFLPDDPAERGRLAGLCREVLVRRCNVVVSGATSSGKTSLLGALIDLADPADRIVVLEDTTELPCAAPHLVRLEARPPTIDGPAPITVEQLVRTALRLRPDRLVVGEVRGDEVLALVQAMNTGHDGSFSTCHANGAEDALLRLESLVVRAAPRWPLAAVRHTIARSVDVILHVERRGHRRVLTDVAEVATPDPATGGPPAVRSLIDRGRLERSRR